MKKLTKEITKTEIIGYEANDGTVFTSESECQTYEHTCKCVIMSKYKELVIGTTDRYSLLFTHDDDDEFDIVEVRNEDDIDTINRMFAYYLDDSDWYESCKITKSEIGKTIFIYHNTYDDEYTGWWFSEETIIKGLRKAIEDVKTKKGGE